jgi:transposase-like protein
MHFSPQVCTNDQCPSRHLKIKSQFIKKGFFRIKRLQQRVRRFQCTLCKKTLSSRTFKADYKHKKMDLNKTLAELLVQGTSLRASSRLLGLTYMNTYLKFLWLRKVINLRQGQLRFSAQNLQFDELETIHHTKCKPLSIALVASNRHELLAAQVAEMPAKGRLAEFSRIKYGPRKDERLEQMLKALKLAKQRVHGSVVIKLESDAKPGYQKLCRTVFEDVEYVQHVSRQDRKRLQDRLHEKAQKRRFDHLFAINHQCARLRDRIKRLVRRSWCTTKKPENLQLHLDLYVAMQNQLLFS